MADSIDELVIGGTEYGINSGASVKGDNSDADLNIGDSSGNVIAQFKNGHVKTKNFDSSNISGGGSSALDTFSPENTVVILPLAGQSLAVGTKLILHFPQLHVIRTAMILF